MILISWVMQTTGAGSNDDFLSEDLVEQRLLSNLKQAPNGASDEDNNSQTG
jgi:hypothetical protein